MKDLTLQECRAILRGLLEIKEGNIGQAIDVNIDLLMNKVLKEIQKLNSVAKEVAR